MKKIYEAPKVVEYGYVRDMVHVNIQSLVG